MTKIRICCLNNEILMEILTRKLLGIKKHLLMQQVVLSDVILGHNEAPYHELLDEGEDIQF